MRPLLASALLVTLAPGSAVADRYFGEVQVGLGVRGDADRELATSWTFSGGVRLSKRLLAVGRLRHTSPFRDSLVEDLAIEALFDGGGPPDFDDRPRTHLTELTGGLRLDLDRLWIDAVAGAGLVYQVNGTPFDNHGRLIAGPGVGYSLAPNVSVHASAGLDPLSGELLRADLGLAVAFGYARRTTTLQQ